MEQHNAAAFPRRPDAVSVCALIKAHSQDPLSVPAIGFWYLIFIIKKPWSNAPSHGEPLAMHVQAAFQAWKCAVPAQPCEITIMHIVSVSASLIAIAQNQP